MEQLLTLSHGTDGGGGEVRLSTPHPPPSPFLIPNFTYIFLLSGTSMGALKGWKITR